MSMEAIQELEETFEDFENFRTRGWMCNGGMGGEDGGYEGFCYHGYKKINKRCNDLPKMELHNSHCTCTNFERCGYGDSFEEADADCEDNKCTASGCTK